ncbi:MAG: radical SAM protein [Blastocatellia bacterium]
MSHESGTPIVISDTENAYQTSGQCDCDCDCACSAFAAPPDTTNNFPARSLPNELQPLRRSSPSYALKLDNNHSIYYGPRHAPVVLNESAAGILAHFDRSPDLSDFDWQWHEGGEERVVRAVQRLIAANLLVPEGIVAADVSETPTTLSAWLHVTDRCNLRCAYCYLPHASVDMTVETGCAAIEATFRSALIHNYRQVKLKYAGGEAMLRFQLVAELHRYARERAGECGLGLDGVALSNGTLLTEEIIEAMKALGLRLMISLDGLAEAHDRQRHFADGRASSAVVTGSVELALANGMTPDISITVSSRNIDGLPELMEWVLERDLPFSLNFYRENDLSATTADLRLEEERIISGMLAAYKVIEARLPRRSLLASLVDFANLSVPHLRTCSVGQSYLVFDYRGRVAKCQMQINKPVTTAYVNDPLADIRADQFGIQNKSVEEKEGCRSCEWKYWCTGGCPLTTFRATGRYDVKSPNCNIYKALYPEAVRLEGLRLLKYRGELLPLPLEE